MSNSVGYLSCKGEERDKSRSLSLRLLGPGIIVRRKDGIPNVNGLRAIPALLPSGPSTAFIIPETEHWEQGT